MITIQTLSDVCFQSFFPVPPSKSTLAEEFSKLSLWFFFFLYLCVNLFCLFLCYQATLQTTL